MKKEEILNQVGEFTWMFGLLWFVETPVGNFVWSDPDYGGDNSFLKTNETYSQFSKGSIGRDKGFHKISDYCGPDIILAQR